MFISEKELKNKFWENYKKRALKYQFECEMRTGGIDLITVELYQGNVQINAFEFKLTDVKKVIAQAIANKEYCHRSWIVLPRDRENVISDKYTMAIKEAGIGVMLVDDGGRWEAIIFPKNSNQVQLSNTLANLLVKNY